jgi:hypothetical protein
LRRIQEDLIGEHSENVIRRAILRLEELGLIERRHNPGNWQDKTWQYKLNLGRLAELLEDRKRRNKESNLKSEAFHRNNPYSSNPNNNNVAVEEEEMLAARWEELAKEVERWEKAIQQQEMERINVSEQLITHEDQHSEVALNNAEFETIVVNCDESGARSEVVSQEETAMASGNLAQDEPERIPRIIATAYAKGAIATSSVSQQEKEREQSRTSLGGIEQDRSAIAPTNSIQQELETVPPVVMTSMIEGAMPQRGGRCAIASSSSPQGQSVNIPQLQLSRGISLPVPPSAKAVPPVVPKKLSEEELDAVEDALKELRINPDSCISVIKKYWENVSGAIARVKEALQQGWCQNATGLFIASCKKGAKPQKSQVSNDVSEWFNWARKERIVIGMSGEVGYTPEGEPVSIREMIELYPMRM